MVFNKTKGRISFQCPRCGEMHYIPYSAEGYAEGVTGPIWQFNGDFDRPTVRPSLMVRSGHYCDTFKEGDSCWCTYNAENPNQIAPFKCVMCHSIISDGKIQFLTDCSHHLAGKVVELPEITGEEK